MKTKILIFTDSRGVHRPAGTTHHVYPLKLSQIRSLEVTSYLCPFQWTTIPDFLHLIETREEFNPANFDRVILHAGIVDHSPRPYSQALGKLYDPDDVTDPAIVDSLFRSRNFTTKKIINRKKEFIDRLFSEQSVAEYYSHPFDTRYEGDRTINLYSEEMMKMSLLPRLQSISNLLFISSNNFCRGWNGDFPKARPSNIYMIEQYSRALCDGLDHVINLHQWLPGQVREYTCDNLHLSKEGSDWIFNRLLEELQLQPRDYTKSRLTIGMPSRPTYWPLKSEGNPQMLSSIKIEEPSGLQPAEIHRLRDKFANGKAIATLIIGVRLKNEDTSRLENLNFLLKWIDRFYGDLFDVLIVEQDSKPTQNIRDIIPGHYQYEFIFNPYAYNRGWLYNVAVKNFSNAKVVAFCDTDILPGSNFVDCVIDCYSEFDAISPNRNLYYSTQQEKDDVVSSGSYGSLQISEMSLKNPTTLSGGMLIVNRERFIEIGGFEQYVGYGCEDRALDVTMLELLSPERVRMDSYAYFHMNHPVHRSERAYFNDIYSHMVENYGCEYDPCLKVTDFIHASCSHSIPEKVKELSKERHPYIGDADMYKRNSYITTNGLPPTCRGKLVPVSKTTPEFPPNFTSLDSYLEKEELTGKYAGSWAPAVPQELAGADVEQLAFFYNRFKGERCFIIGNGPSLNKIDLSLLENEYTFAVNSFYYKTRETGFRPTFFVVEDSSVINENRDEIVAYEAPFKFFPSIYKSLHPKKPGTYFFKINRGFYEKSSPNYAIPRFSTDITRQAFCGQSVTYINLQLAFYMGFTEVFLIGMDFSYRIPSSHKRTGDVLLSDTDDPNHFHKDYFGKGKTWKDPKLDRVLLNYRMADFVYRCAGRKILNATVGGKLEVFERVNYGGLFNGLDPLFKRNSLDLTRPESSNVRGGCAPTRSNVNAVDQSRPTSDSICAANQLFLKGDYSECASMCERLFESRGLEMYRNAAQRARHRMARRCPEQA